MSKLPENTYCPRNRKEWRIWLEENHEKVNGVWLIIYKKSFPKPNLKWDEAASSALCFGWIDGNKEAIDKLKYMQYFGKRKPASIWSNSEKKKVVEFTESGLMSDAGLKAVEVAKENGFWTTIDSVEQITIPEDLSHEFPSHKGAKDFFMSLSKNLRKSMLQWIELAEDATIRQSRIKEIVEHAAKEEVPKEF